MAFVMQTVPGNDRGEVEYEALPTLLHILRHVTAHRTGEVTFRAQLRSRVNTHSASPLLILRRRRESVNNSVLEVDREAIKQELTRTISDV